MTSLPDQRPVRRSGAFAYSDVRDAAETFVAALAEHADPVWEPDDIDALASGLTDKALAILNDPEARF